MIVMSVINEYLFLRRERNKRFVSCFEVNHSCGKYCIERTHRRVTSSHAESRHHGKSLIHTRAHLTTTTKQNSIDVLSLQHTIHI